MTTTFVLVHGAWHGAWCWDRVRAGLLEHGHRVITPTLTGLGERSDELDTTVDLSTHVADVTRALDEVDEPVVLVGHSYAGFVVRQAADQRPDSVRRIVLLDGWFGHDGESLLDRAPTWFSDAMRGAAANDGDGWRIPVPSADLVGVTDPDDAAWIESLVTPHPLATFVEPTRLTGAVDDIPTSAIVVDPSMLPFRTWAEEAGYPTTTITGGHDAMVTSPGPLVDALVAGEPTTDPPDVVHIPFADASWIDQGSGVDLAPLRVESNLAGVAYLRFAAGARSPSHLHPGGEDLYVVSGQLRVGDRMLEAGDFLHTPAGGVHDAEALAPTLVLIAVPEPVEFLGS